MKVENNVKREVCFSRRGRAMLHVGENSAVIETLLEVTLFVRSRYNYVCILYRFGDIPNT